MRVVTAALVGTAAASQANPIRRVVDMLQSMDKKVREEGEHEEELMEKFQCYCKTTSAELTESVSAGQTKQSQLEADIKEGSGLKSQLDAELEDHKSDRAEAKDAVAKATALREKERTAFEADSGEAKTNIDALGRAIPALKKGLGVSMLQAADKAVLRKLMITRESLNDMDRSTMTAFLQAKTQGSGEIVGIMEQMKEDMEGDLAEMESNEAAAQKAFDEMSAAKANEIAAATAAIESKTARTGDVAVELANNKADLADTVDALAENQSTLAQLTKSCADKSKEWEERQKTRNEELTALSETIKILNDDSALELFNKAKNNMGSFVQMKTQTRTRAAAMLKRAGARSADVRVSLIAMALNGKKAGFEKVLQMIDNMEATLKEEQANDAKTRDFCNSELDSADDKKKGHQRAIADLEAAIAEVTEAIKATSEEIDTLKKGIEDLDKAVASATEQRKAENSAFQQSSAENNAAAQLIEFAKNRLNQFYNPKMYKAPAERELTEEERIYVANGGVLTTVAPGGIAGTGISALQQPETFSADYKKSDSNGVITMMDMLKNDIEKEQAEAARDEKEAQKDYEQLMADSAAKRDADSKSITQKESDKAEAESSLQAKKENLHGENADLMATSELISSLHGQCDFILENFEMRKEARDNERKSLQDAKAVLSGADYSFVQIRRLRGA